MGTTVYPALSTFFIITKIAPINVNIKNIICNVKKIFLLIFSFSYTQLLNKLLFIQQFHYTTLLFLWLQLIIILNTKIKFVGSIITNSSFFKTFNTKKQFLVFQGFGHKKNIVNSLFLQTLSSALKHLTSVFEMTPRHKNSTFFTKKCHF